MESAGEIVTGEKREPGSWEKTFSNPRSDEQVISKAYRKTFNSRAKAYVTPSQRSQSTLRGKQVTGGYEKVFHVTNHQGRGHLEPQRTSPCMTLSKNKTLSAGEGMGVGTQEGAGTVRQNNHYWNHPPSNPVTWHLSLPTN